MHCKVRALTFDQLINQIEEQGPLEEVTANEDIRKKVYGTVLEILKTIFVWYKLPWNELTTENMFDKANLLKKVDKSAIRFCKFVQFENAEQDSESARSARKPNKM